MLLAGERVADGIRRFRNCFLFAVLISQNYFYKIEVHQKIFTF
jgi:hypothetical protein